MSYAAGFSGHGYKFASVIGKHIAYGYLPIDYAREGTHVEIAYFEKRYAATVIKEPLFDPKGEKLKA